MFSWECSEFMRVGVDPASDKSDKASDRHPRTCLINKGPTVDVVLTQQDMDTGPLGASRCVGYGSFGSCGMAGGGLHGSDLLWHVRWMLQPNLQIPNAIEHLLGILEQVSWFHGGATVGRNWLWPLEVWTQDLRGCPMMCDQGVCKGSFESCGLWVEDSVNPTCSGTSQRCWKAAADGVPLWRAGIFSTLSRSLGGWCVEWHPTRKPQGLPAEHCVVTKWSVLDWSIHLSVILMLADRCKLIAELLNLTPVCWMCRVLFPLQFLVLGHRYR